MRQRQALETAPRQLGDPQRKPLSLKPKPYYSLLSVVLETHGGKPMTAAKITAWALSLYSVSFSVWLSLPPGTPTALQHSAGCLPDATHLQLLSVKVAQSEIKPENKQNNNKNNNKTKQTSVFHSEATHTFLHN